MFGTSVNLFGIFFGIGNGSDRPVQRESKGAAKRAKTGRQVVIHIKK